MELAQNGGRREPVLISSWRYAPHPLRYVNSRKTEGGANRFLTWLAVRAAPFARVEPGANGRREAIPDLLAVRAAPFALWNSRKTERGAKQFLTWLAVRAAPFALWNSRKTEGGVNRFLTWLAVRAAPFALWNSRKTERGAKQFLTWLAVRAAPFALLSTSCSQSNNLFMGRVEATVDGHRVSVEDCYRLSVDPPKQIDGGYRYTPCRDADVLIRGEEVTVNGRAYGHIKPGDSILVDHGTVSIGGPEQGPGVKN